MNKKIDLWKLHRMWQAEINGKCFCNLGEPFYRWEIEAQSGGIFLRSLLRLMAWLRLDPLESLRLPASCCFPPRARSPSGVKKTEGTMGTMFRLLSLNRGETTQHGL